MNKKDIISLPASNQETKMDELENKYGHGTCSVTDIENMAQEMLSTLPRLNRNILRDEMDAMHVNVYVEPTTFNINEGLAKAQGYRERLTGILALAEREVNVRSKVLDMLSMANTTLSKASSADKRKGEALLKYATQFIYLEAAETFRNEVQMFLNNMKATSETISRQASVIQAQITLGEIHRKAEETLNSTGEVYESLLGKKKPIEEINW